MVRLKPILGILLIGMGCSPPNPSHTALVHAEPVAFDLDSITTRGTLRLLTENTSTSYFLYRGRPMGFDHEMVSAFAKDHGLELEVKVLADPNQLLDALDRGEGDLIACNLAITEARRKRLKFTIPVDETRMVLVQQRPAGWRTMTKEERKSRLKQHWSALDGDTVHVHRFSSFFQRLEVLNRDSAMNINIVEADHRLDSESLIEAVAKGTIRYTLADENMARVNQSYHPHLDIAVPVSPPQEIAWAVRRNADSLLNALNAWLARPRTQRKIAVLSGKYFDSPKTQRDRALSDYSSESGGQISPWDTVIQHEAEALGWDWKWLAALIYHESRFNPNARSWAGATGLMQLMPETAARFGADSLSSPVENIQAGVQYLQYLNRFWEERVPDADERKFFILASYNIGPGHVLDAQCLAERQGLDPKRWFDHTEVMLNRKSESSFYRQECVRHGYCRGSTATRYVRNIASHYRHYASVL